MNRKVVWSAIFVLCLCTWWLGRPTPVQTWYLSGNSHAIAISSDSQLLATSSGPSQTRKIGNLHAFGNTSVELRRLSDGFVVHTLNLFDVTSLAFSRDNSLIAAGNGLGQIQLWRTKDGQLLHSLRASIIKPGRESVHSLIFSPDGKTLVTGVGGQIDVWRVADGKLLYSLSKENNNSFADISPDGHILAMGGSPITLYRLSDGTRLRQLQVSGYPKFSSDGQLLAIYHSTSHDYKYWEKVLLYRLQDDTIVGALPDLKGNVINLAFSPDGCYLAVAYNTGGGDGDFLFSSSPVWSHLALWRLARFPYKPYLQQRQRIQSQKELLIEVLAFSQDGKILASGSWDKTIRLWKMPPQPSWLSQVLLRLLLLGSLIGGFFSVRRYAK